MLTSKIRNQVQTADGDIGIKLKTMKTFFALLLLAVSIFFFVVSGKNYEKMAYVLSPFTSFEYGEVSQMISLSLPDPVLAGVGDVLFPIIIGLVFLALAIAVNRMDGWDDGDDGVQHDYRRKLYPRGHPKHGWYDRR